MRGARLPGDRGHPIDRMGAIWYYSYRTHQVPFQGGFPMKIRTIDQLDLSGKRTLIRVDFNVPMDKAGT